MMSRAESIVKFSEIFETMKKYMNNARNMEEFGHICVDTVINTYYLGREFRVTLSLTYNKYGTTSLVYEDDYRMPVRNGDVYEDRRWKRDFPTELTTIVDCPIVDVFEWSAIINISYTVTTNTPSSSMMESKPEIKPQQLIVALWKSISSWNDFHCATIYHNSQGGASIHRKGDKYECTLEGSTLNSMADLRDYLDGAKINITFIDGSSKYGYVNGLCYKYNTVDPDNYSEIVDGKVVEWKNDKWRSTQ